MGDKKKFGFSIVFSSDFQMPGFLSSSPDLVIVDDIVCDKRHRDQAKKAALDQVLENFAALSNSSTSTSADPTNLNNRNNPYLRTTTR